MSYQTELLDGPARLKIRSEGRPNEKMCIVFYPRPSSSPVLTVQHADATCTVIVGDESKYLTFTTTDGSLEVSNTPPEEPSLSVEECVREFFEQDPNYNICDALRACADVSQMTRDEKRAARRLLR